MATVFLALDLKHDRPVAVKVLRPELAAALGPERFLREIKLASRLTHPHILPLHDSGEADGFLFYVMPYVEGESLRDRLTRERQLPVDDAVRIAREVADALGFAHSHDVIHRDIKPENILFEAGHAVVSDFGIARAINAAGGDRLTETGLAVGTPSYMSPEQAAGSRELDGRSDLYSPACVMYEMLAGEPPFTGPTVESVVRQHLTVGAPPVTTVRPGTPPGVARALERALAKTPADRHPTAAAFAEALAPPTRETMSAPAGATAPMPGLGRVLALYLSASGPVLALVFGAMLALGLPDWFFPGAVVLLLLGLPIIPPRREFLFHTTLQSPGTWMMAASVPYHRRRTLVQTTAAFHPRTLRLDRVGAVTCILAGTKQAFGALGGTDGGRLPRRHRPCARRVPAPIRNTGKTWAASAIGKRSAQRAIRGAQCRPAGIRRRLSRVLFRANF